MNTKSTFGIHFILKRGKIIDGTAPIYARITVDSSRCEISLKKRIPIMNWDKGKGMAKGKSIEIARLNSYLEQIRSDHQRPMHNNAVMKHLERLRKMVTMAVRLEWLDKDPFAAFKLHFKKVEREFLSEAELSAIEKKNFTIERLSYIRDLFVFACYTGLSYIDVMNLTSNNIRKGINGMNWIITQRKKTLTPVRIPLLEQAQSLIDKYASNPRSQSKETLFPIMSNQKLNSYLKEIADLCEVNKNLTFHVARHTFATTVTLTNGVPIESVSKMLGHTNLKTTQIYAKVIEKKIADDMVKLQGRLSDKENPVSQIHRNKVR